MKKFTSSLILFLLLFSLISIDVHAVTPSVSISGPSSVRSGDTVKININVNGSGIQYLSGAINYNADQLVYKSGGEALAGWAVDIENSAGKITFLGVDDKLAAPISSNKKLFSITFTVKSGIAPGTNIIVTASSLSASDGVNDFAPSDAAYTKSMSAPLSGNNSLKSLVVGNAVISPAFSPANKTYSSTVLFTVTKLDISAAAQDSTAKISISNNILNVGKTAVGITVTAENGSKTTYIINVTRGQDPDYKAGSNANLKSITPDKGILSPSFSSEITVYNIYLPFESLTFDVSCEMQDPKAQRAVRNQMNLKVGENLYIIKGIAEDGTQKEYKITVYRMAKTGTSSVPSSSADTGFKFTLSGILCDSRSKPLINRTIVLTSNQKTTKTDIYGYYEFDDVSVGPDTIFIKGDDGAAVAIMQIVFTKGASTLMIGNEITVKDDTTVNLTLTDKITVKSVMSTLKNNSVDNKTGKGIPLIGVIMISLFTFALGALASYFITRKMISG